MLIRQVSILTLLACFVVAGTGCGGSQPAPETPKPAAPPPPAPEPDVLPKGHVWRYQLMEVMSPGLGAFLQRVEVKEQMAAGQFHGFKILELRGDPTFWEGSDIRVGDVITSVNGGSIGHYDEAFRVWQSLATAPEIVIAYERRGDPKQLRIVLHEDDESPEAVKKSASNPAAPAPEPASSPAAAPAPEPASAPTAKDEPKAPKDAKGKR